MAPLEVVVVAAKQVGISPKVYVPVVTGLVVGVVLLLAGEHDSGVAVLLSVAGAGGLGYAAPPGKVVAKL